MPGFTHFEKQKLERELGMASGYVLGFSNRTFEEFFREVVGVEIYDPRYDRASGSKANRMRAFWDVASDTELLALLNGLEEGWELYSSDPMSESAQRLFDKIRARLAGSTRRDAFNVPFEQMNFAVALSFPGTQRGYVSEVATHLKRSLGNQVFYDHDFQAHLARPDLDTVLLRVYRERSSLIVVFLSSDYESSEWCGLEWRAVRDMIKCKSGDQLMFVRFDDAVIPGTLSIDGYIDAMHNTPLQVAGHILDRVGTVCSHDHVDPKHRCTTGPDFFDLPAEVRDPGIQEGVRQHFIRTFGRPPSKKELCDQLNETTVERHFVSPTLAELDSLKREMDVEEV